MLNQTKGLLRGCLVASLLTTACYTGAPDDGFEAAAGERVALLNPLDEALHLDDEDARPRFIAGQRVLNISLMPEAQRPADVPDSFAAVPTETLETWQVLESDVDEAIEDFWLDVAQSPDFDRFRSQWLECVDTDASSEADVLREIETLHDSGQHEDASALESRADGCTSALASSFNDAVRPVYEAWAEANAPLMNEYRSVVMGATDFTATIPDPE